MNKRLLYEITIRSLSRGWMSGHSFPSSCGLVHPQHGTWTVPLRYSEYNDRPCIIQPQCLPSSQLEFVSMVMQGPFSKLTNLLLSSFDLVELILCFIPLSEYLSPEVMVTSLSSLTGLEYFSLGFQFYQTRPDQNSRCPPPMRAVLPALRRFSFEGANEYLEDLVAWIDTPQLEVCSIDLHGQIIYDIPHLSEFISCSTVLKVAHVLVDQYCRVSVKLPLPTQMSGDGRLRLDF